MAAPQRRVQPPVQQYYAVPQSPQNALRSQYSLPPQPMPQPPPQPQASSSYDSRTIPNNNDTTYGVATGAIGGGYGPYSFNPAVANSNGRYGSSRFSAAVSETSVGTGGDLTVNTTTPIIGTSTVQTYPYMWDIKDPDLDDALHNPDPIRDAAMERSCTVFSARGWLNMSALVILVLALLTLFAGYPIIAYYAYPTLKSSGYNLGGINGSGQVPKLTIPTLIDKDTPSTAKSWTSPEGTKYSLVFSDEFETEGRTFWSGDDPFWEAVDFNYWPTGDLEWYTPTQVTTEGGKLVLTMEEVENHNLNFRSAMLQSWNKFCFTTGYIEVSVSLPGSPRAPGFWPAIWTMGNLGRAGYGATTQGTWPFSYDSCDVGTFPNQTYSNNTPTAAQGLSYQPGQKLSACTCEGGDHPGPSVSVGRGVPEIDLFEAQIDVSLWQGQVSQSMQIAPYNYDYEFDNSSSVTTIYNSDNSALNSYKGGEYQQAVSAVTYINTSVYNDSEYSIYGYEWYSNPKSRSDGFIKWYSSGEESWKVTAGSIAADETVEISDRLIPEEPMYIIMNFGMSPGFQAQDWMHLEFPSKMYIDYVRVYQQDGVSDGTTCDPPSYPTTNYINDHLNAYSDANLTTWAQAGYDFPANSLYNGC